VPYPCTLAPARCVRVCAPQDNCSSNLWTPFLCFALSIISVHPSTTHHPNHNSAHHAQSTGTSRTLLPCPALPTSPLTLVPGFVHARRLRLLRQPPPPPPQLVRQSSSGHPDPAASQPECPGSPLVPGRPHATGPRRLRSPGPSPAPAQSTGTIARRPPSSAQRCASCSESRLRSTQCRFWNTPAQPLQSQHGLETPHRHAYLRFRTPETEESTTIGTNTEYFPQHASVRACTAFAQENHVGSGRNLKVAQQ
jgi:hypothetical protein